MPVLQILFESIHSAAPGVFVLLPTWLLHAAMKATSVVEVCTRIVIRFLLLVPVFYLVLVITLINSFINGANSVAVQMTKPISQLFVIPSAKQSNRTKVYQEPPKNISYHSTMFSPADSPVNLVIKTWLITDYCYDRFFLHAPICIYNLLMGKPIHKYKYRPRAFFSMSYMREAEEALTKEDLRYMRSFNLSQTSSPKRNRQTPPIPFGDEGNNSSEESTAKNPTSFSEAKVVEAKSSTKSSPKSLVDVTANPSIRIKFSRRSEAGGTFLSLHRSSRKRKSEADTESIGDQSSDYEQVKDMIRERMNTTQDFDDGSFGPLFVRLAWHCSATYDRETNTGGSNGGTMR